MQTPRQIIEEQEWQQLAEQLIAEKSSNDMALLKLLSLDGDNIIQNLSPESNRQLINQLKIIADTKPAERAMRELCFIACDSGDIELMDQTMQNKILEAMTSTREELGDELSKELVHSLSTFLRKC